MRPSASSPFAVAIVCALSNTLGAQSAFEGPPPPPAGMQQAVLTDRVISMPAFVVNYPATWHFEGMVWQGTECSPVPAQIFRVTSPDGLIMVERMPSLDWSWGNAPGAQR